MSTGKPEAHTCGKMTPCDRCNEGVAKGKACFRIPKMKSGFTSRPIFCVQCTSDILVQSKADIAEIETVVSQYL
jgi:hypothetical protein